MDRLGDPPDLFYRTPERLHFRFINFNGHRKNATAVYTSRYANAYITDIVDFTAYVC